MRQPDQMREKSQVNDSEAVSGASELRERYARAQSSCHALKVATRAAIARQAQAWRINPEQARVLLLDRRMPV